MSSVVKGLVSQKKATLTLDGKSWELPVHEGTEAELAIDITELRTKTGMITLDSGYMNTGSCTSAITFLDGDKGTLHYRGYPIEQLAQSAQFVEVAYLLLNGELPTGDQLKSFNARISSFSSLPEGIVKLIESFPREAHPMAVLSSAVVGLGGHFHQWAEKVPVQELDRETLFCQLLASVKMIAAYSYRHAQGLPFIPSDSTLSYVEDFLWMMFGPNQKQKETKAVLVRALDILLTLHADHEQNCSASTVRMVGSSKANLFATVSSGIDALWGPLHGGANQKVIEMLESVAKEGGDYKKFIARAKDKNDSFLLMGFGHRVYKNFDPRAKIIKKECDQVLEALGVKDQLLDIAKGLETEALHDEYFVARKLYPNVDFYSGIIYRAMGIPTNMFTVMFALGRLPGWLAQWKEMMDSAGFKISRPRQVYTGERLRAYQSKL